MNAIPNEVTMLVDTREKRPLPFPVSILWLDGNDERTITVRVKEVKLGTGDHYLEQWPTAGVIEVKRSLLEVYKNLFTKDNSRQCDALRRLSDCCTHPYLLLEGTPASFFKECKAFASRMKRYNRNRGKVTPLEEPGVILDRLIATTVRYSITLLWLGDLKKSRDTRRAVGETIVRILLRHAADKEQWV